MRLSDEQNFYAKTMIRCATIMMAFAISTTSSAQNHCSGFAVVFETSAPLIDLDYVEAAKDFLSDELTFRDNRMELIQDDEWEIYRQKPVDDILVNHFSRKHSNSKLIFRFIFLKAPEHHSKGVRLFQLKVINLSTKKTTDIADAYTFKNIEKVMDMAIAHMKNMTCGKPAKDKVYIIDDKTIANGCRNYRNSIITLMSHENLYDLFYVLKAEPNEGNEKNIVAVFVQPSSTIKFEYRLYDDYVKVESPPSIIDCNGEQEDYLRQVNTYCKKVCEFCKK
jgi:hypothetical protein